MSDTPKTETATPPASQTVVPSQTLLPACAAGVTPPVDGTKTCTVAETPSASLKACPSGATTSLDAQGVPCVLPTAVSGSATTTILPACPPGATASLDTNGMPCILPTGVSSLQSTGTLSTAIAVTSSEPNTLSNQTLSLPSTTPTTLGSNAKSDGLGGGAVAGVAIACLLGGAAIAAAILFFLFRRKKNTQPYAYGQPHPEDSGRYMAPEKSPLVASTAMSSNVDNFLPQPVEDDAITQELSKIRDNLKNHVRSYYHYDPMRPGSFDASALSGLATATGMHTSVLATLLSDVPSRNEAIRVFLAWVILSKCDGSTLPSLLPDDLSGTVFAIQNKEGANIALVSKWKAITGALLQQQPKSSSRAIAATINEANAVLAPFVRGSVDGAQRQKNLEMILSRAAGLAFTLFSQPGSYRFDFAGSGDSLVTFPALLQTIGDDARTLNPPRVLWKREVDA